MPKKSLLSVTNLNVSFFDGHQKNDVVRDITFNLSKNEITAIVGESGSGKSVTALAIMGLFPKKIAQITQGEIIYDGRDLVTVDSDVYRAIRGKDISMIFQEPMSSLNPSMTCGNQVAEILKQHAKLDAKSIKLKVLELFEQVKLPEPNRIYKAYPHAISGGQKQRVMIAMAIACDPKILIADEPTTALDVTVQKDILTLLKDLQAKSSMSILFISHDLTLVSEFADRVMVMYKGEIVEQDTTQVIFKNPKHNYTKALINARPSLNERLKYLPTINDYMNDSTNVRVISKSDREEHHKRLYKQEPLLEISDVHKTYLSNLNWFSKPKGFNAVDGVSFKVYPGETLGLVGESGCGKSTLGNAILQLDPASSGTIKYKGEDITHLNKMSLRSLRKDIQIIFQDPFASLNPRLTVGSAILEPMKVHGIGKSDTERRIKVINLMEQVGLDESFYNRFPHEFSGGQRQRISIARTIALEPKLIICDESVSALDISVQAQVLNLLNKLKRDYNFTYIFISHDLAVVKYMSDQLVVMNKGKIEEIGEADSIYNNPHTEYTKKLIHAIPKGH
ncbi:MAG: ABC transporter ATP-binding protein [Winogradskyella sp.]|nr:ABC transporter ATP-binding protein [Winogradskyella sp.]